MIGFTILSHNIQGKFSLFEEELNRFIGERPLNVVCLQDVGYIGPDGPISWKDHANTDRIITNYSSTNKSRSVAVLVGKEWDISKIEKNKGGGLLAVTLHHDLLTLKVINAYLPPGLDSYGKPDRLPSGESLMAVRQKEALESYHTLTEWAQDIPNWVLVGDLNETRDEKLDRTFTEKLKPSRKRRKFVEEFLSSTGAIDMWRSTFPSTPNGHTRRDPSSHSTARLDYIIASPGLHTIKNWQKQIWLGGLTDPHSDHQPLHLGLTLPIKADTYTIRPWSTRRPKIPPDSEERKQVVYDINRRFRELRGGRPPSDELSKELSLFMVRETGSRFGLIGGFPRNRVLANRDSAHLTRLANAVKRLGEYHREYSEGNQDPRLLELIDHYLRVLQRFQKLTISPPYTDDKIKQWLTDDATELLRRIREEVRQTEYSIASRYREAEHKQFLEVSGRSKWLTSVGLGKHLEPPPRWLSHPRTDQIVRNPKEIKKIYIESGAPLLQNRKTLGTLTGPPRDPVPPEVENRPFVPEKNQVRHQKPKWWDAMYDRKAKGISAETWSGLMKDISTDELRETIAQLESDKAPGYDGVSIDLIKLLTQSEEGASLETLTELMNVALRKGESWHSWRKSIISLVPKKKPDGSYTSKVEDMRPISVMQEFAKLTSKVLANRLGKILLESPNILNKAQRAFLRNGCINQCIHTAINVFEDFRERKSLDNKAQLYVISYDQQKAYDCVQKYTIRASLERFNLPENFIKYVESFLEDAVSCFKTFYGPTEDFQVLTSVRQGDPLSPLVYIFITDALHEGLKRSHVGGQDAGGYTFSNDCQLKITSSGYADDMNVYAQSWRGIWEMHQWVREFCIAHHWSINVDKCEFIISDWAGDADTRWLYSVDGQTPLRPKGPNTFFRYLGVWLSMNLQWEKQREILQKRIILWRSTIVRNKVNSVKALTTVRDFLFPKLELGLQFADIDERTWGLRSSYIQFWSRPESPHNLPEV